MGEELGAKEEPSMLDLLDEFEAVEGPEETIRLIKTIGAMAQANEGDRDTLGSFGGVGAICDAVEKFEYKGPVMLQFMQVIPSFCMKSPFNRVVLKDNGVTSKVVDELLAVSRVQWDPDNSVWALALCNAMGALCRADDANKMEAARIRHSLNQAEMVENAREHAGVMVDDGQVPLFTSSEGAMDALLRILEVPDLEPRLVLAAFRALRACTSDDDARQASCAPAAVENREWMTDEKRYPRVRQLISTAMENPTRQLAEVVMGIVKEVSWAQDKIFQLVYVDKIMPKIIALTKREDPEDAVGKKQMANMSKSVIIVLRQFCFSDEMKTMCAFETDFLTWAVLMVKRHTKNESLCEQAFGLFSNMTIRMPAVAELLASEKYGMLSIAHTMIHNHWNSPSLLRTVVQTIRNLSKAPDCLAEISESVLLDELREMVKAHREDEKWRDVMEISRQFLREMRCDDGLRAAPKYNEFY